MKKILGILAAFAVAIILFAGSEGRAEAGGGTITVSSPSGGTFAIGQSVSVQWESSKEFDSFNIILEKHGEYAGNQMWNLAGTPNPGGYFSAVWSPRDYLMEQVDLGSGGGYRLAVCGFIEEMLECGYSGEFSIENDEAPPCTVSYREYAVSKAVFPTGEWVGCNQMSITFTGYDIEMWTNRIVGSVTTWDEYAEEWFTRDKHETFFSLWAIHNGPGSPVVLVRTVPVPGFSRASIDMHIAHEYAEDGINTYDVFVGTPSFRKISGGDTPVYLLEIAVTGRGTTY
jgi:hypothetical protein